MVSLPSRIRAAVHALANGERKVISTRPSAFPFERYVPFYVNDQYALAVLDDLIAKRGIAPYREMIERDDQVSACVRLQQFSRLSTGWELTPAGDGKEGLDQEVCDFVGQVFDGLEGTSINDVCMNLMDAFVAGFSIQEKVYREPYEYGDFAGKQGYRTLRPIPQETITFKRDQFGEIEPDGIWQAREDNHYIAATSDPSAFTKLERDRFVVWSWFQKWGNPLGMSLLRPAYRWYMIKDLLVRSWAQHTERFGLPLVDLEVATDTTDSEISALEAKIRNFVTGGALVHRGSQKLTITPTGTQSAPTYQPLLAEANRGISRSILTPATLFDQPETGAYSLGESQKSVWIAIHDNLGNSLTERAIVSQIIRPLVLHNYGPDVDLPKFAFKPMSTPDLAKLITAATMLADRGFPVPFAWVERESGIPQAQPGENALGASTATNPIDQMPPEVRDSGANLDDLQASVHEALAGRNGGLGALFGVKVGGNGGKP